MSYSPIPPHGNVDNFAANYAYQELLDLAKSLQSSQPFLLLQPIDVEPEKPRDGMVVLATDAHWHPGAGAGIYARIAGAWEKL